MMRSLKGFAFILCESTMYSDKFLKFIEMWQKDFAIERSIDEKVCVDKDNNPIPWYTYPAIEYLSQFDYSNKEIFEYGCGYSSMFWANRAKKVTSIGRYAFGECSNLKYCYSKAVTPPVLDSYAFPNTIGIIYVPRESVDEYKALWSDYASKIIGYDFE